MNFVTNRLLSNSDLISSRELNDCPSEMVVLTDNQHYQTFWKLTTGLVWWVFAHQSALLGACLGTCLRDVPSIQVALRLHSVQVPSPRQNWEESGWVEEQRRSSQHREEKTLRPKTAAEVLSLLVWLAV